MLEFHPCDHTQTHSDIHIVYGLVHATQHKKEEEELTPRKRKKQKDLHKKKKQKRRRMNRNPGKYMT